MKSDMLTCLENLTSNPSITPAVDAILFYAAALVNMLKPSRECTVLCKSNKSEFRRNLCFVLIEILQKLSEFLHIWHSKFCGSRRKFKRFHEISLRTSKNQRNKNSHQLNAISANFHKILSVLMKLMTNVPERPTLSVHKCVAEESCMESFMGWQNRGKAHNSPTGTLLSLDCSS